MKAKTGGIHPNLGPTTTRSHNEDKKDTNDLLTLSIAPQHHIPAHGRRDHRQLGCGRRARPQAAWRCAPTVHEPRCGAAVNSTSDGRASCCRRHSLRHGVAFGWCAVRAPVAAQQLPPHRHAPLLPPKQPCSCLLPMPGACVCRCQIVAVMLRSRLVTSKLLYHSLLSCFAQV